MKYTIHTDMDSRLTVQVLGWNSAGDLPATCAALEKIPADEVIIRYIDNASSDDSVEVVQRLLPNAEIVELAENKGFSSGNNEGFMRCTTDLVLVLNPDVVVDWEGIKKVMRVFEDNKVAAAQGLLLRDESVIDSAGIVLSLAMNGVDRGAGEVNPGQYNVRSEVKAVTGACGLYRMKSLRDVTHKDGEIFDNDFFAYKEDVDLGWRLNHAGWKVVYEPVVTGVHKRKLGRQGAMGWGSDPAEFYRRLRSKRTRYSLRNWVWMIVKNITLKEGLKHEIFIDARLLLFFCLSFLYPPLVTVWLEIIWGLTKMAKKRKAG
ncbi:MAG: glycosyltransferase family 2 protein [bacterium]|nr:glycosyltransferase family 2 protein [bacterium]